MNQRASRTKTMTIRVDPKTLEAAQLVAKLTGRTVSSLTEYALRRFIEKNYPDAFTPGAVLSITIDDAPAL